MNDVAIAAKASPLSPNAATRSVRDLITDEPEEPQVLQGLGFDEYQAIPAVNNSARANFAHGRESDKGYPLKFKKRYEHRSPGDASQHVRLVFGSAYHCWNLERSEFHKRYAVLTDSVKEVMAEGASMRKGKAQRFSKNLKEYQGWREDVLAAGRMPVDESDYTKIRAMAAAIRRNTEVWEVVQEARAADLENAVVCSHPLRCAEGCLRLKGRLDMLLRNEGETMHVIDFKTTLDVDAASFVRTMERFGYDLQMGFYALLVRRAFGVTPRMSFLAHEHDFPYGCCLHEVPSQVIDWAVGRVLVNLEEIGHAIENDHFPEPESGMLLPSPWRTKQLDQLE